MSHLRGQIHRRRSYAQPASSNEDPSTEEEVNRVAEHSSSSISTDAPNGISDNNAASVPFEDRVHSQSAASVSVTETQEESHSDSSVQSLATAFGMHRQAVMSPVIDEYFQIMGNAVTWTGDLLMQFLRMPMLPRGNRLLDLRQAAHMDPSNAEKYVS